MNTAPAWLTYASLVVAVLSMTISGVSAVYASRTYRRAGVSVKASVSWERGAGDDVHCRVRVTNSGLSAVGVHEMKVALFLSHFRVSLVTVSNDHLIAGREFPARLDGSHTESWVLRIPRLTLDEFERLVKEEGDIDSASTLVAALQSYRTRFLYRFNPKRVFSRVIGLQLAVQFGNGIELSSRPDFHALISVLASSRNELGE